MSSLSRINTNTTSTNYFPENDIMSTRSSIEFMNTEEEILKRKIENIRLSNNDSNTNQGKEIRYTKYLLNSINIRTYNYIFILFTIFCY